MSLQNMTRAGDVRSKYVWTRRSTSEAYFGSSEVEGVKDQTLFLRGFKLDFSQAFRARMKRTPCMLTNGPSGSGPSGPSDASKGAGDNEEPGRGRGAQFGGRDGGQSNSNGSHSSPFGGNSSTNAAGNQDQGSSPYPQRTNARHKLSSWVMM
ncbi:hypothetical protein FA13DRAFT_592668 [Coprinellus micaceus]|uniref:Uncharacterized protein n=1 Tax=Coprinellus micaceus TaxID=71717 RepID=A0A4Y7SBE8_COPMI|nr:hypothetical protein FA13DRAFT_592668 [Coprinellus micaceus]